MQRLDNPRLMEPLLPPEGTWVLEDLAVELASVAAAQPGKLSEDKGSFEVLREVILLGALPRAKVTEVTGYKERQARSVVSKLLELEVLTAESVRAPLKLHIPHEVVSEWFPRLYPGDVSYP